MKGINVFDELELPKCGKFEENSVFNKITTNSLAPPKCNHCLPPCNNKKYGFKVIFFTSHFEVIYFCLLFTRKLKGGLVQTELF